jgi:tetratricopeptide (TPR) repeat protein
MVTGEESNGEIRYRRLETIRQYARERFFETDEVVAIRDRHLAYYVQLSEEIERGLQGPARKLWMQRSEAEQENLRTAMEWGLTRNPESSLRVSTNMIVGTASGGYSIEGFSWLSDSMRAMESTLTGIPPALRAKALSALAFIYFSLGREQETHECAQQSIALYRQLDDKSGLASALLIGSMALESSGQLAGAEAALNEALALAQSDQNAFVGAWILNLLARVTAKLYGDTQAAWDLTEEAIRLSMNAGLPWHIGNSYEIQGFLAEYGGQYEQARGLFEKAMLIYNDVGAHFNVLLIKSNLAHLERQFGHHQQALERYRESIVGFRDLGHLGAVAHQLECFGFLAMAGDGNERALRLFAAADALREKAGSPMTSDEQTYFDEQIGLLRQRLDPTRFERIWTNGRTLSMEQALEFALGENNVQYG